MNIYREKLYHLKELQKQAYNKGVKSRSYTLDDKAWLKKKYIKTKQNRKLKIKFFGSFQVLYSVIKQAYKLKLVRKWKNYNIFHMLLLE